MKDFIRKITSRKLWVCIVAVALGVALANGVPYEEIEPIAAAVQRIAGYAGAIAAGIAYILGEARIDAAGAANSNYLTQLSSMFAGIVKPAAGEGAAGKPEVEKNPENPETLQ